MAPRPDATPIQPFLRWVGGKYHLVPRLVSLLPSDISERTYYEPFAGAAALFLALQPKHAVLSDANVHLIQCLRGIRDRPNRVHRYLRAHRACASENYYYEVREVYNQSLPSAAQAARFVFLNKTCFNGIFRVNTRGQFNVPYGFKEPPTLPSLEHLRRASRVLRRATLRSTSFRTVLPTVPSRAFVYLDPPYPPLNGTSYFTHYTADRFRTDDQLALAEAVRGLDARGIPFMMTNADTQLIRSLYKCFRITPISVTRYVTCRSVKHPARELVITNYV